MNIEIGKPSGNEFTQATLERTSVFFAHERSINSTLFSKIASVLSIPLFDVPEEVNEQLLIGTDLIPSLLYPSPSLPNRCISLASNLNLIETRLGFYFQGTQINTDIDFCHNWLPKSVKYYPHKKFKKLLALAFVTCGFIFFCHFDYTSFCT